MSNANNQSYEVQVYHGNRWVVHAHYETFERGIAIREAKGLADERKSVAVRVIMEDYNPSTGRHDEILVFRNKVETKAPPKQRSYADMAVTSDGRVGFLPDEYDYFDPFDEEEKIRPKVSFGMFFAIIGMILVIGGSSGVIASGGLAILMKAFSLAIADASRLTFLVGMFVVVFIIGSVSSLNYYRAKFDLNPFGKQKKTPPIVKKTNISKQMEKAAEEIDKIPVKEVEVERDPIEEFSMFDHTNMEESEVEPEAEFSPEAQQQKMFLIKFLGTCLGALKGPEAHVETLNRFGLNLFMTGAVIRISTEHNLTESEENEILCRILEMLGAKEDQAERFAMEYEKYLEDSRHKELFDTSGDIAHRYSEGDQAAPLYIRDTMQAWINWKPLVEENVNPNLLIIMFTDMVGSTDLTTKHGDYAAQEVLKAHDLIVRTALTNFDGKEIKHLGDGIMASFKDYDLALQASIEIQKRVEGNNNSGPEFPLHVRVGLNAGEPIKKDNDLFGTSVQLAARLCDNTPSDGISISQDLKDLFGEQPIYTFVEMGFQQLKGFDMPLPIYHLDWTAPALIYEEEPPEGAPSPEIEVAPDLSVQVPVQDAPENTEFDAGLPLEPQQTTEEVVTAEEEIPKTV